MTGNQGRVLPAGWISSSFGEITTRAIDQTGPIANSNSFLYVDISSIDNKSKRITEPKILPVNKAPTRARQRLIGGDVLVSMTRPNLNAVAILPETMNEAIGTSGFHVLRADGAEPKWLFYLVQTDAFIREMSEIVQGVVYPAIRPKDVLAYRIPVAPIAEQRRIISVIESEFTCLDSGVSSLERIRHNLGRYRAAVLQAACEGRLVPTEAELARVEGRDYEPADLLLAHVAEERRARWEADQLAKMTSQGKSPKGEAWRSKYQEADVPPLRELSDLPEGWALASLSQLAWDSGYGTSEKCDYDAIGPPVLRIPNISKGRVSLSDIKCAVASKKLDDDDALQSGDFLLIRTNGSRDLIGRGALVRQPFDRPHHFASYLIRFRLVPTTGLGEWLATIWHSPLVRQWIERAAATSAGQYNVSLSTLNNLAIPIPPAAEQARIVAEVERRLSLIDNLETVVSANLKRAGRLRQAILKLAFEGKLVPQDPADEPAEALLARIGKAKVKPPRLLPGM